MATYTPLQSITLTSSSASIIFSNIDQNYTDLRLVFSGTSTRVASSDIVYLSINGETLGTNGSYMNLYGTGSAAGTGFSGSYNILGIIDGTTGWGQSSGILDLFNYSNLTTFKTSLARSSASDFVHSCVNVWRQTTPINSIRLWTNIGLFAAGTTVDLYGIKSGSPKAMGGQVTTDGTYWYHTFTNTGIFEPVIPLTVDYLVVAGGGGGAVSNANGLGMGGGGAGGLRCTVGATGGGGSLESPLSLTAKAYTVSIGAGGSGGLSNTAIGPNASNGSNSVFATITSIGGGRGGNQNGAATSGGSGGGDSGDPANQSPGAGTANQGYAGGNAGSGSGAGSGGGGAGAVGGSSSGASTAGAGGSGATTSISGTSTTYAGGGGGSANTDGSGTPTAGAGGSGGGGAGGLGTTAATNGTANRGGGGGAGGATGSTFTTPAGSGGSGIVIVRYAV
jgi:hypothetical protein